MEGSSGACGFNKSWEAAVLHHQGIPYVVNGEIMTINGRPWDEENMSEDEIQWVANEGISISRIVENLKQQTLQDAEQKKLLLELLELTKDPLLNPIEVKKDRIQVNPYSSPVIEKKEMAQNNNPAQAIIFNFYGNTNVYVGANGVTTPVAAVNTNNLATNNGTNGSASLISSIDGFIEKKQKVDQDYDNRPGYDTDFLNGYSIELPEVIAGRRSELFTEIGTNRPYILKYHHFSLVMNKVRRFLMWSASNVNYDLDYKSEKSRKEFGTETWIPDPRIPEKFQVTDLEFYKLCNKYRSWPYCTPRR